MNGSSENGASRLWAIGGFRQDKWKIAETVDPDQRVILPLNAYLQLDEAMRNDVADTVGVELQPSDDLNDVVPHLGKLPLIALAFPAFSDGRSFSNAELLRSRHDYRGTIRATGEVLIDQIPHMLRTGIDEFSVTNETALQRLEEGRIGVLPHYYQPAAAAASKTGGYSWRRQPA